MALECSVVVPLCNEEQALPTLHLRLTATLRRLAIPYEIIYVDDGSTDETSEIIRELHRQDSAAKGIFLSRNFGHQAALCAGLEAAAGRAVITIDGDLQDPPEVIPELMDKWHEGCKVIFARRRRRKENLLKKAACFAFYRLLRCVSEVPVPLDTGDFALMDRQALAQLNSLPERTRFIRGLRCWVGFKQAVVEYDRGPRPDGKSKYTLSRLFRLALDGIFAFSEAPLKAVTVLGALLMALGIAGGAALVSGTGAVGLQAVGAIALASGLALVGGIQLIGLGIVGQYVARIYREVRGRPLYVTRERVGFQPLPRLVPSVADFLPSSIAQRQEIATASRLRVDWPDGLALRDHND